MKDFMVEIHVAEVQSPLGTNFVGVVAPPLIEDVEEGDTVTFVNRTGKQEQGVQVWLPVECYKEAGVVLALAKDGDVGKIEIVTTKTAAQGKVKDGEEVMYKVFCEGIREFAVGNSPPKMKIKKP